MNRSKRKREPRIWSEQETGETNITQNWVQKKFRNSRSSACNIIRTNTFFLHNHKIYETSSCIHQQNQLTHKGHGSQSNHLLHHHHTPHLNKRISAVWQPSKRTWHSSFTPITITHNLQAALKISSKKTVFAHPKYSHLCSFLRPKCAKIKGARKFNGIRYLIGKKSQPKKNRPNF